MRTSKFFEVFDDRFDEVKEPSHEERATSAFTKILKLIADLARYGPKAASRFSDMVNQVLLFVSLGTAGVLIADSARSQSRDDQSGEEVASETSTAPASQQQTESIDDNQAKVSNEDAEDRQTADEFSGTIDTIKQNLTEALESEELSPAITTLLEELASRLDALPPESSEEVAEEQEPQDPGRFSRSLRTFTDNAAGSDGAAGADGGTITTLPSTLELTSAVTPASAPAATGALEAVEPLLLDDSDTTTVTPAVIPTLSISVPATVSEGTSVPVTVSRLSAVDTDLTVILATTDTGEGVLPITVIIPAGQTSVTTQLEVVNDGIIDGNQSLSLTATSPGFIGAQEQITVSDINAPLLHVELPSSIGEGDVVSASVTTSIASDTDRTIELTSSDPEQLSVPASVTIPAGSLTGSFDVTGVEDVFNDEDQAITITATSPGFTDGEGTVTLTDTTLNIQPFLLSGTQLGEGVTQVNTTSFDVDGSQGPRFLFQASFFDANADFIQIETSTTAPEGVLDLVINQVAFDDPQSIVDPSTNEVTPFQEAFTLDIVQTSFVDPSGATVTAVFSDGTVSDSIQFDIL